MLETSFNAASLWNILFWPGFLVDLGTSKMFKWENPIVNIELEPEAQPKTIDDTRNENYTLFLLFFSTCLSLFAQDPENVRSGK